MRELYVVKLQLYVMHIEGELYAARDYTEAAWRRDAWRDVPSGCVVRAATHRSKFIYHLVLLL